MVITREMDYAIRVLRRLQDGKMYIAKDISTTEHVPEAFAYKILNKLTKAGITSVIRGGKGGYKLVKDPKDISMVDLIVALEVKFYLNACLDPDKNCSWKDDNGNCTVNQNLSLLQDELVAFLSKLTIHDLFTPQDSILGTLKEIS